MKTTPLDYSIWSSAIPHTIEVDRGVKQGCVLSLVLFQIVIDWVMKNTVDGSTGIFWENIGKLEDLEYAEADYEHVWQLTRSYTCKRWQRNCLYLPGKWTCI